MQILPILVITVGDPAGIGPEITVKSFWQNKQLLKNCIPVVVCDFSILKKYLRKFPVKFNVFHPLIVSTTPWWTHTTVWKNGVLNIIDLKCVPANIKFGIAQKSTALASIEYINFAVNFILYSCHPNNYPVALVTAPVSKESIIHAGIKFTGHTEYLAEKTGTKKVAMMIISKTHKVLLVTRHIALKDISKKLTKKLITDQILTATKTLKDYFEISKPKIFMCNFNPHSGEGGKIGIEEKNVIIPAIDNLRNQGLNITGPLPTDIAFRLSHSIFHLSSLIVCYYHDQALVPLKLLSGGGIVNLTCGLPFIRTSPVHGTAFDIAGKFIADPTSMLSAIELAQKKAKSN